MSEATSISAMLKSISHGPAWHGPSLFEALEGVKPEQAAAKPANGAHSIWEILLHMIAWQDHVVSVLDGGDGAALEGEADWPPVPDETSEETWQTAKRHFDGGVQEIRERVVHLDEKMMREKVRGRVFPLKVLLHGIVHHNLYHLGQIALLKKRA